MYKSKPVIGVIGSSKDSNELNNLAENVGRELAKNNVVLICGGLTGIMQACCQGAKKENGLTIGVLPGTDSEEANSFVDIKILTGIGEARNLVIIRSSCSVIAIGGSYGTLSEIAFALRLNIPVIGLNTWELNKISKESFNIIKATSAKDAVNKALIFAGKINKLE